MAAKDKPETVTVSTYVEKAEDFSENDDLENCLDDPSDQEESDGDDATRHEWAPYKFKVGYETMLKKYMRAAKVERRVFSILGPPPGEPSKPKRANFESDSTFREAELRYYKKLAHHLGVRCARLENQIRDLKTLQDGMRADIRRAHQYKKDKDREDEVRCDVRYVNITAELNDVQNELNLMTAYRKKAEGEYQQRSRAIELMKLGR